MRVLFLHEDSREPGYGGGAESMLRDLTVALERCGHTVDWWQGTGPLPDVVEAFKPDVCHILTIHNFIGLQPAMWLQHNKVPHVWSLMDYWPWCKNRMLLKGGAAIHSTDDTPCAAVDGLCDGDCATGRSTPMYREVISRSPVLALNPYTAEIYERHGVPVFAVTPLGVDVDKWTPDHSKRDGVRVATSCAWPDYATKGMHVLKAAIREAGVKATLITGVSRERVRDELQKASIYVFPSTYMETWGLSLNEALACGCACIASDVCGARAQITHGENGLLFPNRDAHALAGCIRALLDDDVLRETLGRNARVWAVEHASLDNVGRVHEEVYRRVMPRYPTSRSLREPRGTKARRRRPQTGRARLIALLPAMGGTNATVSAVTAAATADALAPTVTAVAHTTVSAVIAEASAVALAPSIAAAQNAVVNAETATATAEALEPAATTTRNVSAAGETAEATADALAPVVSTARNAAVSVEAAEATADEEVFYVKPSNVLGG